MIGADRVAGQPSRLSLPSPVIGIAQCMLGCRHTVSKTYGPAATKAAPASASGWDPTHGCELSSEHEPGAMAPFTLTQDTLVFPSFAVSEGFGWPG